MSFARRRRGLKVECVGRYLQSLRFYVENDNLMLSPWTEYRNEIKTKTKKK